MIRRRVQRRRVAVPETPAIRSATYLCEVSWEVCNLVGGIYTVVRSKSPYMVTQWGDRYCLLGPYYADRAFTELEEDSIAEPFASAAAALRAEGVEVHTGHWLVSGRPQVVLLRPASALGRLNQLKYYIWERHHIDMYVTEPLVDETVAFGHLVERFIGTLAGRVGNEGRVVAHFHEWMAATALADIRRTVSGVATVFTTHATQVGRCLANSSEQYAQRLPGIDWAAEARRCGVLQQASFERLAAHSAHVFTTVSEVTGRECEHVLSRVPDMLLPNGLNIERFTVLHEFQNLHRLYKEKISQFVLGHFFPSYTFDLDQTLYFFTSGRYEYVNKGFNLTIEALARLNRRLQQTRSNRTIVCFLITRANCHHVNPEVLRLRALTEELRRDCEAIEQQVGDRLFLAVARDVSVVRGKWPGFEELVDEYSRLRLRRDLAAWKTERLPYVVTHDLVDEAHDPVLNHLRAVGLTNRPEDRVKVVFHPVFVSSADLLFRMDYDQFVRGCHLGVFPSLYEPWGYTPLECVAHGIPTITSDMAGFGSYVLGNLPDHYENGIMVVRRRNVSFDDAAEQMVEFMYQFSELDRRERIALRNRVEEVAELFDWHNLGTYYDEAHALALQRV